jgi:hypothetical protein
MVLPVEAENTVVIDSGDYVSCWRRGRGGEEGRGGEGRRREREGGKEEGEGGREGRSERGRGK